MGAGKTTIGKLLQSGCTKLSSIAITS